MSTVSIDKPNDDIAIVTMIRPEVLNAVNAYFGTITGFGNAGRYTALVAGAMFATKAGPSVELMSSDDRPSEAKQLARAIREMHDLRGIDYGSIAMLFRVTTDMSMYEEALVAERVPYFSETGRGKFYVAHKNLKRKREAR